MLISHLWLVYLKRGNECHLCKTKTEYNIKLVLTVDIPSLFGDLLLDGVVYRCDRWWCGGGAFGGSHWPWWDVGLACRCWWLPGWDKGLPGGNCWLAWRRGDSRWRLRCFGRCRGSHSRGGGGCWFGDNGEDSLLSHWWAHGGGGPLLIHVGDAVVMIWRQFAWSRGVNNHLRNGWNDKRMQREYWNMST